MSSAAILQREKYEKVHRLLAEMYGEPAWQQRREPIEQLVRTILSQQTSAPNREQALQALRDRFATWDDIITAPLEAVYEAVHPAGLANQKAPRIQEALAFIKRERGELSLDFLEEMPADQALQWLQQIKGVGAKSAALVLLFAFHRPVFPIDKKIIRVTRRLGLLPDHTSTARAQRMLAEIIPPDAYYAAHVNLIRHGRELCRPRAPLCHLCPLQALCDAYQRNRGNGAWGSQ